MTDPIETPSRYHRERPLYWLDREGRQIMHNEDFIHEPYTSWDLTPVYAARQDTPDVG